MCSIVGLQGKFKGNDLIKMLKASKNRGPDSTGVYLDDVILDIDLDDFCDDNGYVIPSHVSNQIIFNRVSHTCLHPESRNYGVYEIIAETSYGNLFYEVCESNELGN